MFLISLNYNNGCPIWNILHMRNKLLQGSDKKNQSGRVTGKDRFTCLQSRQIVYSKNTRSYLTLSPSQREDNSCKISSLSSAINKQVIFSKYNKHNKMFKKRLFTSRHQVAGKLKQSLNLINRDLCELKNVFQYINKLRNVYQNSSKLDKQIQRLLQLDNFSLLPKLLLVDEKEGGLQPLFQRVQQNYASAQFRHNYKSNKSELLSQVNRLMCRMKDFMFKKSKERIELLIKQIQAEKYLLAKLGSKPAEKYGQLVPMFSQSIQRMEIRLGQFKQISPHTKVLEGLIGRHESLKNPHPRKPHYIF